MLPAGVSKGDLSALDSALDRDLASCSREQFGAIGAWLASYGDGYGVRGDARFVATEIYRELGHIPAWAVGEAVRRAVMEAEFPRFPLPKEVKDRLPSELWRRVTVSRQIKAALANAVEYRASVPIQPVTAEQAATIRRRSGLSVVPGGKRAGREAAE